MSEPDWRAWRFLLGDWVGIGVGAPGESDAGGSTFALELDDRVLARRNWARYAATSARPAFTHEDLLYVHPNGVGWRAVYMDNEGHVIHYRATADGARARFESEPDTGGMRYRLRYDSDGDALALVFDIAPPGGDFATYVSGRLERRR